MSVPANTASRIAPAIVARLWRARFVRFLLVGVLNTLFGYGVFSLALLATGGATLAAFIATLIGAAFNFRSIGALVFNSSDRTLALRFFGVYGFLFLVNATALAALAAAQVAPLHAQALLLPGLAGLSYLLNRDVVFRPHALRGV